MFKYYIKVNIDTSDFFCTHFSTLLMTIIIAKRYTFTTSNIKNSVFLAKDTKRSEKDTVGYTKIQLHHPSSFSGANCWFNNLLREKSKKIHDTGTETFYPKIVYGWHQSGSKVYFRSFDLFPISFWQQETLAWHLSGVHPRVFSLRLARPKRTARLLSPSGIKSLQIQLSISWFLHILLSACKSLS